MRKLDPARPWGKITPPWSGDNKEFDRPAVKEQDGRLFDQYNCEILPPGKKTKRAGSIQGPAPPTVAAERDEGGDDGDTMQRLDPSFLEKDPDVGKFRPPWRGDSGEFDRAAFYQFDGKLFDAHGIEIVPGKKLKRAAAPPPPPPVEEPDGEEIEEQAAAPRNESEVRPVTPPVTKSAPISPAELLERAGTMAFAKFAAEAKRILGRTCPTGKQAIIAALREAIAEYKEQQAKRYSGAQGMTWGGINVEKPAPEAPTPAAPAAKPKMPVYSRERRQG
jgi:hypothetical protein